MSLVADVDLDKTGLALRGNFGEQLRDIGSYTSRI